MTSSDTEGVPTVVDYWEPDLMGEEKLLVYRHGYESNKDKKETECVADGMLGLARGKTAVHKPHSKWFSTVLP